MANPTPRPALRKAPDAHINPANPHASAQQIDLRTESLRIAHAREIDLATRSASPASEPVAAQSASDPVSVSSQAGKKDKKSGKKDKKRDKQGKTNTKSKKSKNKKASNRVSSKLDLSASARRKLRAADKARGANLDGHVDSVVDAVNANRR